MRNKLRISGRAVSDIKNVLAQTLDRLGERQLDAYKALVRDALRDIAADPDRPPAKHRPELHPNARTFHIARRGREARHFFLYRITGDGFVDIGRLLHDSMDLQRHLPEGFAAEP